MTDSKEGDVSSYRQILNSSIWIGGASLTKVALGALKLKVFALLLGPSGVGLYGLLLNIYQVSSVAFSVGLETSTTKLVSQSRSEGYPGVEEREVVFAALWLSVALGLLGFCVTFLTYDLWVGFFPQSVRQYISRSAMPIAIGSGVVLAVQIGLLSGMRRIKSLAVVTVISAIAYTLISLLIVKIMGDAAIEWSIALVPVITVINCCLVTLKIISNLPISTSPSRFDHIKHLLRIGVLVMIAGLAVPLGSLLLRNLIVSSNGMDALGIFQSAWTISMTYLGFVLYAMGRDFLPRISRQQGAQFLRSIDEQMETAIIVSAPAILCMITFADQILLLLYSQEFVKGSSFLRTLLIGDILKIMAWPLGFSFIALGKMKQFIATQFLWVISFPLISLALLDELGLLAVSIAYIFTYILYISLSIFLLRKYVPFRLSRQVVKDVVQLVLAVSVLVTIAEMANSLIFPVGCLLVVLFSMLAISRLNKYGAFSTSK